jgi:hypothetical protein
MVEPRIRSKLEGSTITSALFFENDLRGKREGQRDREEPQVRERERERESSEIKKSNGAIQIIRQL